MKNRTTKQDSNIKAMFTMAEAREAFNRARRRKEKSDEEHRVAITEYEQACARYALAEDEKENADACYEVALRRFNDAEGAYCSTKGSSK